MKKKSAYHSDRVKMVRKSVSPPGASPGLIQPSSDSLIPKLVLVSYNSEAIMEMPCENLAEAFSKIKEQSQFKHWLEIKGLGEKQMLEELCEHYSIHRMEMKDVVNAYQRPKMEEHTNHILIVSR